MNPIPLTHPTSKQILGYACGRCFGIPYVGRNGSPRTGPDADKVAKSWKAAIECCLCQECQDRPIEGWSDLCPICDDKREQDRMWRRFKTLWFNVGTCLQQEIKTEEGWRYFLGITEVDESFDDDVLLGPPESI